MRNKNQKPWLTSTGVEIPKSELLKICKSWNQRTWEDYLNWYDLSNREVLVSPKVYEKISEEAAESIFEQFGQNTDPNNALLCDHLLSFIPSSEAAVLKALYFEGKTERQIAAKFSIGKTTVHTRKTRGILSLQQKHQGDKRTTRQLMRGADFPNINKPSIWDQPLSFFHREDKLYDPSRYKEELSQITHSALRIALSELSEREQRILYLRFWCDYSFSEIARELRTGVNLIEQVIDASVSKLKRKIVCYEIGMPEGGPSCA